MIATTISQSQASNLIITTVILDAESQQHYKQVLYYMKN